MFQTPGLENAGFVPQDLASKAPVLCPAIRRVGGDDVRSEFYHENIVAFNDV